MHFESVFKGQIIKTWEPSNRNLLYKTNLRIEQYWWFLLCLYCKRCIKISVWVSVYFNDPLFLWQQTQLTNIKLLLFIDIYIYYLLYNICIIYNIYIAFMIKNSNVANSKKQFVTAKKAHFVWVSKGQIIKTGEPSNCNLLYKTNLRLEQY